jgi:hypothetical protein
LVITSDTRLAHASLVEDTWNGDSATDKLATQAGFAWEEAGSNLRFGPLLKGEINSTVHIWNITNYASVTLTANAYDATGFPIALPPCTAAPMAQCTYDAATLTQLPSSFVGALVIEATGGSVLGIMALNNVSGDINEYRRPLTTAAAEACLPRVLKHVNEGGVMRSTTLFVANSANQAANVNLAFYDQAGTPVVAASQGFSLTANGSRYLRLVDLETLPDGIWAVCAGGNRPLALEEVTQADTPSRLPASSATRGANQLGSSNMLALTHLVRSDASYTAFSVQNPGSAAANVDLKYYDISGTLVYTDSMNLPPRGWARFNQSTQPELGNSFVGSQVVSSDQPVISLVDAYVPLALKPVFLPLLLR